MLTTMLFSTIHLFYIISALWIIWNSRARRWTLNLVVAILTVFTFEHELYREILRLCGFVPPVTLFRMESLRVIYVLSGMFLSDLVKYYEHAR